MRLLSEPRRGRHARDDDVAAAVKNSFATLGSAKYICIHSLNACAIKARAVMARLRSWPKRGCGKMHEQWKSGSGTSSVNAINNKRWIVNSFPFKHIVVQDVFNEEVSRRLRHEFIKRVSSRDSKRSSVRNYDATILPLANADKANFAPLLDLEWLRLISRAMGLDTRFEVDGALHSHPPGSRSGWLHNDYNPGWFARAAGENEVYLSSTDGCEYRTGKVTAAAPAPVMRMRYLTLLYYLNNHRWAEGMGGETGIYTSQRQKIDQADRFVAPLNNSLLLFECTPHSWHSFRATSSVRNSITLWLHRDFDQAKNQWPHHEPVYWT